MTDDVQKNKVNTQKFLEAIITFQNFNSQVPNVMHLEMVLFFFFLL